MGNAESVPSAHSTEEVHLAPSLGISAPYSKWLAWSLPFLKDRQEHFPARMLKKLEEG